MLTLTASDLVLWWFFFVGEDIFGVYFPNIFLPKKKNILYPSHAWDLFFVEHCR